MSPIGRVISTLRCQQWSRLAISKTIGSSLPILNSDSTNDKSLDSYNFTSFAFCNCEARNLQNTVGQRLPQSQNVLHFISLSNLLSLFRGSAQKNKVRHPIASPDLQLEQQLPQNDICNVEVDSDTQLVVTEEQIKQMTKTELINVMQTMIENSVQLRPEQKTAILEKFTEYLLDFSPCEISQGLKYIVQLSLELSDLIQQQVCSVIYLGLGEYGKQERIDLIQSFAKLNLRNDQLLDVIGKWLAHEARTINPNVLCNVLECYEQLGQYYHTTLRDAIVEVAAIKISDLSTQSVSLLLRTLVKLNQSDSLIDVFLDTLAIDVLRRIDKFEAEYLVDLIWGYAKLHHRGESKRFFFTSISQRLATKTKELAPQYLPKLIWGLARVEKDWSQREVFRELYKIIACKVIRKINLFSKDEVLELCEGLRGVRYYSADLFDAVQDRCQRLKGELTVNDVAGIIDMYAFFDCKPNERFFQWALKFIYENCNQLSVSSVCTTLWALSLLDSLSVDLYHALIQQLNDVQYGFGLGPEELQKLYQANVLVNIQLAKSDLVALPDGFQRLADQAWEDRLYRSYHISRTELEIADMLRDMGIKVEVEQVINKVLMVDMEIRIPGKEKVVLEIDGVRRFTINSPYRALGDTVWSRRLLREFGYNLIVVSTHEWKEIQNWGEKQKKLRRLIQSL
eukprot:TRINITY_DN3328_c0_g2_i1.p1 TRINITY_DN3328_c0_g2~~TRINITY_DN3328_c0_g2_i1.p1  ORF type:complete len:681 (-),score=36.86 TRINITY_DN3328_c0_g2_i1:184-2226(-)